MGLLGGQQGHTGVASPSNLESTRGKRRNCSYYLVLILDGCVGKQKLALPVSSVGRHYVIIPTSEYSFA